MPSRTTGPLLNREVTRGTREWFSNLPVTGANPDLVTYFNDFLVAGDYSASDWVVTETDSGATQAIAADELGGALKLTNTDTEDHIVQLQSAEEFLKLSAGKKLWFEIKAKLDNVGQNDGFLGLATTDTTPLATTDCVGFRWADASAAVLAITEDNTSETTTAAVHTWVADTYATLGFYWDGVSTVKFFRNRSLVATHTTTIEQTNKLALTLNLQAGAGVADVMTVDYIYVAMER